jgi:NADH-quinone oxidoreductase subunit N
MADLPLSTQTILLLAPEIVLATAAALIYFVGAFVSAPRIWPWLAAAGVLVAGYLLYGQVPADFNGPLVADSLGIYVRWLSLGLGLLFLMLLARGAAEGQAPEIVGSLLLIVTGMMLVSVSADLALMFLGLELISIPTYVLLYLGRRDVGSQESTTKYFFLSILSSALLLYGFSFIYGLAGSTFLEQISSRLSQGVAPQVLPLAILALVLVLAGLGFRITAAPFHFYAPDVYQGTTHGNAALLSIAPKVAGLVALVRLLSLGLPGIDEYAWRVTLILAVLTMTTGNVLALWQDNLRRLLAYSSIAHAGYLLIGVAVALAADRGEAGQVTPAEGVTAILFYLCVYALATLGTFAALEYLGSRGREVNHMDQLAGVGRAHPVVGVAVATFMFSLTGIPPVAGFWGKLVLFFSALGLRPEAHQTAWLTTWFVALAVVGVLNAAISAGYYLRVVGAMYFRQPLSAPPAAGGRGALSAMLVSGVLVLAIGLFPQPWVDYVHAAADQARLARVSTTQARDGQSHETSQR